MIVLDANILIRAVLGRRVREPIDTYPAQGVRFFSPDVAFADAERYLPPLLKKRGKPHDISEAFGYLQKMIERVPPPNSMPSLRPMRDCACVAVTKATGQYWPQLWDWHVASGPKTRTSLEQASQSGTQIAIEIFLKDQAKSVDSEGE